MEPPRTATAIEAAPEDDFQQEVKQIVGGVKAWDDAAATEEDAIAAQRRAQVQTLFDGAEVVDLVGHSTPINGYLKLGDWTLAPSEATRLCAYLPASVKSVRLIGCATARTEAGRAAVEAFARGGRAAFGTVNKVYTTHFDRDGVKRGGGGPPLTQVRATAGAAPIAEPPPPKATAPVRTYAPAVTLSPDTRAFLHKVFALVTLPFRRLFAALGWSLRVPLLLKRFPRHWIPRLLSPFAVRMPGLLTEPLLVYRITAGHKRYQLEILYDFEYARFYRLDGPPARRDLVYKIRGWGHVAKTLLETYLEIQPKGIELVSRHAEAGTRGGPLAASR